MCDELMALTLAWQDRGMTRGDILTVALATAATLTPPAKAAEVVILFGEFVKAAVAP